MLLTRKKTDRTLVIELTGRWGKFLGTSWGGGQQTNGGFSGLPETGHHPSNQRPLISVPPLPRSFLKDRPEP